MTVLEIANRLEAMFTDLDLFLGEDVFTVLMATHIGYAHFTLDQMRQKVDNGHIDYNTFHAYCYLWRNMTTRFSSECEAFQL